MSIKSTVLIGVGYRDSFNKEETNCCCSVSVCVSVLQNLEEQTSVI